MSLRLQRAGFASWVSATEVAVTKQQLRACIRSLSPSKRSVRKAINSWIEYVYTIRALSRGAAAMRLREERVAFSTWHEHVWSEGERDAAMRRAVASMMQSSMRVSLNTWMSYAEEHAEASRVLSGALSSLQPEGRAMRSALNTWAGVMMQRRSMVVAVASLTNSEQLWGLRVWSAHAALVRRQRERVEETARRAIKSMSLQSLRAAMNTWVAMSKARQRNQLALLSAASSFRGDGMRKAWNGWLGLLHDREVMASAVYCSTHRLQRAGFASWVSATKGSVTKLLLRLRDDVSSICSLSLAKRSLRKAISSWIENVEPYRMYAIAGHRLKLCLLGRGLATWVSCWRSDVRSARELRRKVLEHVPLVALKAIQTEDETILWPSEDDNASPTGSRFPSPSPPPSP